jgi:ribosomal protein S18 acetylase RimI-like enzyme
MLPIRMLSVEDAPLFVEVRRMSLRTDPSSFGSRPDTDPMSRHEIARERFARATPEDGPIVLGAFDSELVGMIGMIRVAATSAQIWGFYVRPESRGRGTGRALVRRALDVARQMPGVCSVELGVSMQSSAARHLYIEAGFQDTRFDAETETQYMALQLVQKAG